MSERACRVPDPTPAEIEQRKGVIQQGWSDEDRRHRAGLAESPLEVPLFCVLSGWRKTRFVIAEVPAEI